MRICILTFHWATNYGAVLQAYALQEKLIQLGNDVKIIDYYPKKFKKTLINAICNIHITSVRNRIRAIKKEKKIEKFRLQNINRTKYYSSNKKLKRDMPDFECIVVGSDQVWNSSFFRHGEGMYTGTYFCDFVPSDKIIASYAGSFGATSYEEELLPYLKKYFSRFDFISVREKYGIDIVKKCDRNDVYLVPDPTLLLKKEDYLKFINKKETKEEYFFVYMLHGKKNDASKISTKLISDNMKEVTCGIIGINEWLTNIYYSEIVVTNSFHGVVFSIIFEKPFVAILIKGSGMNDRITTLLEMLGLSDRIYNGNLEILDKEINWNEVKERLNQYREVGIDYINKIIKFKKENKDEN